MAKPKLILLHGALGSKEQLEPLAGELSSSFSVYTFSFSGHGGNASGYEFSIEGFTKQLLSFIKENQIEVTYVFGYSMGGYVALNAAIKEPQLFMGISTLGTKFDWNPEVAAKEIRMLNPEIIESKVPAFARALEERHNPISWKKLLSNTSKMMTELGAGNKIQENELRKIEIKTFIGLGDMDNMVSKEESAAAADLMPNAEFSIYKNVPHPIEKVDKKFLSDVVKQQFNIL